MRPIFSAIAVTATPLVLAQSASQYGWSLLDYDNNQWSSVEERDVCIIGGGASGVHAAVRLKDMNQTVAVVEQRDYLGGHTYTYVDPKTKATFDIGVIVFQPFQLVQDYFARFNIPLVNQSTLDPGRTPYPCWQYNTTNHYIDFRDGLPYPYAVLEEPGLPAAIEEIITVLSQYKYLLTGYELPEPVPEDLYMPFGAFISKYNLTALVRLNHFYSQGQADMLNIPTIYIIKYFNLQDYLNIATRTGWLSTARYNTSELYTAAGSYIGASNIFLSSSIITTLRKPSSPFQILLSTPSSQLTLLSCSKLLLTAPPTLANLANWDLSPAEHSLFSYFTTSNGYWTALITNTSLPNDVCFTNVSPRSPYNLPIFPGMYELGPILSMPGVWNVKVGSPTPGLTTDQVKAIIRSELHVIQRSQGVEETEPEYLVFHSHTPFQLQVSPHAIKRGFYRKLNALQGGFDGRMWYSGAAFHTHDSSFLWRFNEDVVLPRMMGDKYKQFEG